MDCLKYTKGIKNFFAVSFLLLATGSSYAGVIVSAKDAVISVGESFNDIDNNIANTYNQAGLYNSYFDNVTDFDSYMDTNPYHTSDYNNQEWFSKDTFASVVYDLGGFFNINAVALWNEESSGINLLDLFGSIDGVNFFNLASNLRPTDSPYDESLPFEDYRYTAEVFDTVAANLRFVRFDMSKCPNESSSYKVCSIGEVAFRVTDVPAPSAIFFLILGLIYFVFLNPKKDKYR